MYLIYHMDIMPNLSELMMDYMRIITDRDGYTIKLKYTLLVNGLTAIWFCDG